jgi:hypothetical protein
MTPIVLKYAKPERLPNTPLTKFCIWLKLHSEQQMLEDTNGTKSIPAKKP